MERQQADLQHRPHPHKALNPRQVESVKPTGRALRLADGNGLYLLVSPTGTKSWVLRTLVHGHRRDIGLGSVNLVSLKEARDEAQRLRRLARDDGDPLAERRRERKVVPTFREAAETVHAANAATFRNPKHAAQWLSSMKPVFDAFGTKPVKAVSSSDIISALAPRWLSHPETSRRVLQRVRTVFDWAIANEFYASQNPTNGIKKALPKHRDEQAHHPALPYAEVPSFLELLKVTDASESSRSPSSF